MKPLKKKVSVTLDGDLIEKAKLLAQEDDRSLSQIVNMALKAFIASKNDEV